MYRSNRTDTCSWNCRQQWCNYFLSHASSLHVVFLCFVFFCLSFYLTAKWNVKVKPESSDTPGRPQFPEKPDHIFLSGLSCGEKQPMESWSLGWGGLVSMVRNDQHHPKAVVDKKGSIIHAQHQSTEHSQGRNLLSFNRCPSRIMLSMLKPDGSTKSSGHRPSKMSRRMRSIWTLNDNHVGRKNSSPVNSQQQSYHIK